MAIRLRMRSETAALIVFPSDRRIQLQEAVPEVYRMKRRVLGWRAMTIFKPVGTRSDETQEILVVPILLSRIGHLRCGLSRLSFKNPSRRLPGQKMSAE